MIRPFGVLQKGHTGLLRGSVSFLVIAVNAGTDQVFPGVLTAINLRHDMVNRHRSVSGAAVLTAVPVPFDDILSG